MGRYCHAFPFGVEIVLVISYVDLRVLVDNFYCALDLYFSNKHLLELLLTCSVCWNEIVEVKKIDETIIILSLISNLLFVGETIAYFGLNDIICLIDENDLKRKDNKRT